MRNHNSITPARYVAPAEILSFWEKFCVWDMKILLCSIEQKTQKKSCSTQKNFIQKDQIEQKNGDYVPRLE